MAQKIAGVVILYHPHDNVINNIMSYLPHLDSLLLIDNSQPSVEEIYDQLRQHFDEKIAYLPNAQNYGIAKPLNQGAAFALSKKADWLLTMDQDSRFQNNDLDLLIQAANQSNKNEVGLLTPFHRTPNAQAVTFEKATTEVRITMTSGNLLNLDAYKKCGSFDERLFIDSVDHEYCLRLRKNNYKLIRINRSILNHELGRIIYHRFIFFKIKTTNHSAYRRYYITRNRLYVMFRYFSFDLKYFRRELKHYLLDLFKILLVESNKIQKLKQFGLGTLDFIRGIKN